MFLVCPLLEPGGSEKDGGNALSAFLAFCLRRPSRPGGGGHGFGRVRPPSFPFPPASREPPPALRVVCWLGEEEDLDETFGGLDLLAPAREGRAEGGRGGEEEAPQGTVGHDPAAAPALGPRRARDSRYISGGKDHPDQLECFRRVNSGGECGAPRERGRNLRRQGVPREALKPGDLAFLPISVPARAPRPPVVTLRKQLDSGGSPSGWDNRGRGGRAGGRRSKGKSRAPDPCVSRGTPDAVNSAPHPRGGP